MFEIEPSQQAGFAGGTQLTFTLDFGPDVKHALGRFRLSVTGEPTALEATGLRLDLREVVQLPRARKALPMDSPQLAGLLAQIGMELQTQKKWTAAEPLLRESLAIREKTQPDVCSTFNTKSLLGGALPGQKKYADAEPLLLAGYEGMKQREKAIPEQGKIRLPEAVERLMQLYETTGKKDEAATRARSG